MLSLLEEEELDLPVAYDMEIFDAQNGRICSLDKEEKTMMALRFCDAMETAGYRSMIYGNYNWLYEQLDFSQIQKKAIWYAAYRDRPDMTDPFEIWQYSNMGQVQGITGNVDLNICLVKNN